MVPSRWWDSTVAETQESTTKAKASTVKSARTTSRAKNAPASGALKAAAIPAAVPEAASSLSQRAGRPRRRPNRAAALAPSSAIGPSGPTEPPPPMVRVADTVEARAGSGAMVPSPRRADQMTPPTPWPVGVRPARAMTGPTSRPETSGARSTNHVPAGLRSPTEGPRERV